MRGLVLTLFGVTALWLAACSRADSPAAPFLRDPEALRRGRLVFVGTCGAYCHALTPERREAPDLFDCEWKHGSSDADLYRTISQGVPGTPMPAFAGALPEGDTDLWKVIAFLRSSSRCSTSANGG
jgi:mono/diheme cytochrome c family protein